MQLSSQAILKRLGVGEPIAQVCAAAGISRPEFDSWWREESRARVPAATGTRCAAIRRPVRIDRDSWGIPHILAETDDDLFFGFGYAMAQDRLFQLDYLRRRGSGRLAEVLGADEAELDLLGRVPGIQSILELDLLNRTVGIRRSAETEWGRLSQEVRALLTAFSHGINAHMEEVLDRPPIEFDLLDYRPEPWSPVDCLTIEGEFRWYLTGRFSVIVTPELAKRVLGDGPLYRAFLQAEAGDESILPPGSYPRSQAGVQPVGVSMSDPQAAEGSNNWVLAGTRTNTGKPLLASDPHIAFDAVSCWYEAHLCGGSFNTAGAAYVGMPGILFGRNEHVAWGCTNNICSQRDLYQEKIDPAHPECFLFDGCWERARTRAEIINVRGGQPVTKTIRLSRNGPIVDGVLPPAARQTGPVSLKWLGAYQGGWLTALLGMNRARSAEEFRAALEPWQVPTFNVVFADTGGHIGYQTTGRIPLRAQWERGYRPGWDPEHQWQGLIPFAGMPRLADPPRGWIATANNRVAPDDFPYPLAGTWSDGNRALRIRQMIEPRPEHSPADLGAMQMDDLSLRALRCLPSLVRMLSSAREPRLQEALAYLRSWDGRMKADSVAAAIFEVFFSRWTRAVVRCRFDEKTASFLAGGASGLAASLLAEDTSGWFTSDKSEEIVLVAFGSALDHLATRLGPEMSAWAWGKLHELRLRHVLSGRGDLGQLLDHGGLPVQGNAHTVCNTGLGPNFEAKTGANYRLVVDLSAAPPGLWAVDSQSQSGHPGSPHYGDQLPAWMEGGCHCISLDYEEASRSIINKLSLEPNC